MASASKFTFEMSAELRSIMDEHPEVNWSEVFRQAIRMKAEAEDIAARIQEELSDPRVQQLSAIVTEGAAERFQRSIDANRG